MFVDVLPCFFDTSNCEMSGWIGTFTTLSPDGIGFKTRPLRDGGGKPSAARRPPNLMPVTHGATRGASLAALNRAHSQTVLHR